jgi:phosphatidylinositol alpha 1,6-mannosyltransferase
MDYSTLKVAYFAGTMKPGHDGVTRVLYKLIEALNANGIKNIFFSPIIPPEKEQPTKMYEIPSLTFPVYKDYRFPVAGHKSFEDKLEEFKPDILHINSPCPLGYAAVKYGLRHNIPVVATYHTHFASYAKYYKVKALESVSWSYFKVIYNNCETVYVPSKPILEELNNHGLYNLQYLPHGVDTNIFNPVFYSEEWKSRNNLQGKTILLFVGRLVWEKDLNTLSMAYRILKGKRDDVALVIVGDGPIKNELKEYMPDAIFLGQLSGSDLSTAYASSDIFVFPSTTETFGNVTIEAMASGIPPTCAKEGGAYGIIDDGVTGLITTPRDPIDLANKIEYLVNSPAKRKIIAANALAFAKEQSWEKIFIKLFLSYQEVLHNYLIKKNYKKNVSNRRRSHHSKMNLNV